MGSIRIQPPVATSGSLPPPLTSTSSPRPGMNNRQMVVKAVPIKSTAGSHLKINNTLPAVVQTNNLSMPQSRLPATPNVLSQPMINKVQTPANIAAPLVTSSKPPSKEKEKKTFSSTNYV